MPDKPADQFPSNLWPLLAAVVVFGAGTAWAGLGHWRAGAFIMAAGLGLAALLRLVLPEVTAGLLVVRRRAIDVLVLTSFAVVILVLVLLVPPGRYR